MKRKSRSHKDDGTIQVTLTLPAGLVVRLDDHARVERRSRSNAATLLIERALDAAAQQAKSA